MPITPSERNQIASYKIMIEGYRKDLQRLKEDKKRKSEHYTTLIKNTKDVNSKRSYRQSKISAVNMIMNQIDSKKRDIERAKTAIENLRK